MATSDRSTSKSYFYANSGQRCGPVTAQELRDLAASGKLSRSDMVWQEGVEKGTPASWVKGLFPEVPSGAAAPAQPSAPPSPRAAQPAAIAKNFAPLRAASAANPQSALGSPNPPRSEAPQPMAAGASTDSGRIFVSHSSRDANAARQIAVALEDAGIGCWIAPRDIPAGADYNASIMSGLQASRALLLVHSRESAASKRVFQEVHQADAHRLPIFSIRIDDAKSPPELALLISTYQWIDAYPPPLHRHLNRIVAAVTQSLRMPRTVSLPEHEKVPRYIGPYQIRKEIGEGGMGTVFFASQLSPIKRDVAIKRIKLGLDTKEVLARFESERQALARMDHPNIARVFDAGADDSGKPYFVMEYVPGTPITEFADKNKLSISKRLELFKQVCQAIAHAHTKGIIHRDIKSGNILAYLQNGEPTAKVIDFGVAKATGGERLSDRSYATESGFVVGTYDAMSPEQAEGSPDIDTRTDVYSLGVLLYELLTGAKPFDRDTLAKAADSEVRRMIREVEPPRPSARLSAVGQTGSQIALARDTEVGSLTKALRSELEWIPMMAMRKERDRRYANPMDLAADIDNYLTNRPLKAGPEALSYRLRKSLRRNRTAVVASLAVLAFVVGGTSAYVHSIRIEQKRTADALVETENQRKEADRQRTIAEAALIKAQDETEKAVKARNDAEQSFTVARKTVDEFASEISRNELNVIPGVQPLRQRLALRALEQYKQFSVTRSGDAELQAGLAEARLNYAQVLVSIGSVETAINEGQQALLELEPVVDKDGSYRNRFRLAKALSDLGDIYWEINQLEDSEPLTNRAIDLLDKLHAEDSGDVNAAFELARCLNRRGNCRVEKADRIEDYERSRSIIWGIVTSHPKEADCYQLIAASTFNLAMRSTSANERSRKMELLKEAAAADQRVLSLTPNAPRAVSNSSLGLEAIGQLHAEMGNKDEARTTFEEAEKASRRVVAENPKVTRYQWLLASTLKAKAEYLTGIGEFDEARRYYQDSIQILDSIVERVDDRPQFAVTLIEVRSALASFSSGIPRVGGKRDEAAYAKALDEAVTSAARCAERFPKATDVHYHFAKVLYERSHLAQEQKRWEAVREDVSAACEIFQSYVLSRAATQNDYRVIAYTGWLQRMQEVASEFKDRTLAKQTADMAMSLSGRISDPEGAMSLGGVLGGWGQACKEDSKWDLAIEAYESELRICNEPFKKAPWHWYLRSNVAGAYLHLSGLYETVDNIEKEVRARQAWLRVWGAYFCGMTTESYLDPDPAPSASEAARLREVMKKTPGMKRFTVPCDFNGLKYPFHIYISDTKWPQDPLEDQARWLDEVRGGKIPEEVRESFRKLHKIAHENNVSFQDLCVYALGTASDKTPEQKLDEATAKLAESKKSYAQDKTEEEGKGLVDAHAARAEALVGTKQYQEAMAEFRRGIAVLEEMINGNMSSEWAGKEKERLSERASYAKLYYIATGDMQTIMDNDAEVIPVLLQIRATEFFKEGKLKEVEEAAGLLAKHKPKAKNTMYNAACAYSLCATLVLKGDSDPSREKQAARDGYVKHALQTLAQAVAAGYKNAEQMRQDEDLTPLRELPEFKKLLDAITEKAAEKTVPSD